MTESIRVLHVDDEPGFGELAAELLERESDRLEVLTEPTATEGLERLTEEAAAIDCVVSDYDMSGMDGLEFLEAVRQRYPELPFVLFTGKGSEDVAAKAIARGVTDYLQKEAGTAQYAILANRIRNAVEQTHTEHRTRIQKRIAELVRTIQKRLVRATTREEVDAAVCETLADAYVAVWIGDLGETAVDETRVRAVAGIEESDIDDLATTVDGTETGTDGIATPIWMDDELQKPLEVPGGEIRSGVTVPLVYDGITYGALHLYAADGDAFDADELELLGDLGETIAHAHYRLEVQTRYERQYRELFEEAPVMFALTRVVDGEPVIEDCNRQFAETLGYDIEELSGRSLASVYTGESASELLGEGGYDRALSGEFLREERTLRTRTGDRVETLLRAAPRRNENGDVIGSHALFVDVTDRTKARESLRQVQSMEASIDGMALFDPEEGYVYVNRAYAEIYGYDSPEAFVGNSWRMCYDDEEAERLEAEVFPKLEETGQWRGEATGRRADGTTFPQELSLSVLEDGGIVGVVRDVTDRAAYERELERYETIVEAVGDPVYTVDADGRYTFVNDAYAEMTGYAKEEIIGEHASFLLDDRSVERANDCVRTLLSSDTDDCQQTYEITVETSDGRRILCEDNLSLLSLSDGQYRGAAGVVRDITERKHRERTLERTKRRFEAIFNNTYTFVGLLEPGGTLIEANETALSFGGVDRSAVVGKLLWETYWFQFDDHARETARRAVEQARNGQLFREELWVQGDDRDALIDFSVRPITNEDGEVTLLVPEGRDVTERKHRERKLQTLQEWTQSLISASTVEQTAQVAVEAAEDVFDAQLSGFHRLTDDGQRLELLASTDTVRETFDPLPSYDRTADDPVDAVVWDVYESGEALKIDDTRECDRLAGNTPPRSGIIYPIGDHGVFVVSATDPGAFDSADTALADILASTLRTAIDRVHRVYERQRRLEALHETTRAAMAAETTDRICEIGIDAVGEIIGLDMAAVHLYDEAAGGLAPIAISETARDLIGEPPTFTPGDSIAWRVYESGEAELIDDVRTDPEVHNPETQIRSELYLSLGDHGVLLVGSSVSGLLTETDRALGELLAENLTAALDRADREATLRERERKLQREVERLDQFASVVSHDLRNPLNVASGRLALAAEDCDSEHFDAIAAAHDRMEALIEDLLWLAREGEAVADPETVDLPVIVDSCWRNVDTENARLRTETDRTLRADSSRLKQLLENLIRNSVEHGSTSSHSQADDAVESRSQAHGSVTITVGDLDGGFYLEDDGPGVPEDERERIFEPGYSDSTERTGFGLSIVRRIANAHGWQVCVTDGTDGGARFEITGVEG